MLVKDCRSTNGTLLNGQPIDVVTSVEDGDTLHFGNAMYVVHRSVMPTRTATVSADSEEELLAQLQFAILLARPGVQPRYQPIVNLRSQEHIGYEVLSRSQLVRLETPTKMFHALLNARRKRNSVASVDWKASAVRQA